MIYNELQWLTMLIYAYICLYNNDWLECSGMIRRHIERDWVRLFSSWEELQECNQRCLEYAEQSGGSSGQQFMESLSECNLESDVQTCMSISQHLFSTILWYQFLILFSSSWIDSGKSLPYDRRAEIRYHMRHRAIQQMERLLSTGLCGVFLWVASCFIIHSAYGGKRCDRMFMLHLDWFWHR